MESQRDSRIGFGIVKRINGLNNYFVLALSENVTNNTAEKHKETVARRVHSRAMPGAIPCFSEHFSTRELFWDV
jgi:hypothetical protein